MTHYSAIPPSPTTPLSKPSWLPCGRPRQHCHHPPAGLRQRPAAAIRRDPGSAATSDHLAVEAGFFDDFYSGPDHSGLNDAFVASEEYEVSVARPPRAFAQKLGQDDLRRL